MKLPNPQKAFIDKTKLTGYCLNPEHPEGQHKACVFKAALGIDLNTVDVLIEGFLCAIVECAAVMTECNAYGNKYKVDFILHHQQKSASVRSVWIIRNTEDFPRLVTCHVL